MINYKRIILAGFLIGWGIGMFTDEYQRIKNVRIMATSVSKFERPIGNDKAMISEVPNDESL
jgi:hypothetical protein